MFWFLSRVLLRVLAFAGSNKDGLRTSRMQKKLAKHGFYSFGLAKSKLLSLMCVISFGAYFSFIQAMTLEY